MAALIKLTYFEGLRGRGEIPRLVMFAAEKPFEDVRPKLEDYPSFKPNTPFGSLPMLEIGDQKFAQGIAIASYLAKENGLYGSTNIEQLQIDQIQLLREDLIIEEAAQMYEEDQEKKAKLKVRLDGEVYPKYLANFNKLIEANKGSQYVVGNKLSVADIAIFEGTQTVSQNLPELLAKYPAVVALRKVVSEVPGIKAYLASAKTLPV